MTRGSRRYTTFTSLIHDLNKQSSLKGPFTLGNPKNLQVIQARTLHCRLDGRKYLLGKKTTSLTDLRGVSGSHGRLGEWTTFPLFSRTVYSFFRANNVSLATFLFQNRHAFW